MDHSRMHGFNSALSPMTPMKKSSLDFSPNPITTTPVESSRGNGLSTSTPENLNVSISNLSPIQRPHPSKQQKDPPNSSMDDLNSDSFNARMEAVTLDEIYDDPFNRTNINDRRLSVGSILDDLGLKQYEPLMKEMDLISFLTLTDDDLKGLGITDANHREMFKNATKIFCDI